jgi:hypothetical protein
MSCVGAVCVYGAEHFSYLIRLQNPVHSCVDQWQYSDVTMLWGVRSFTLREEHIEGGLRTALRRIFGPKREEVTG